MTFLITFSAIENAIGRSAVGGNSVAWFAALSAKSLPGIFQCPGIHLMVVCARMVFNSIWTPSTRAFQPSRASHKDFLSVEISTVLPMVGLLSFVQCKAVDKAANFSPNEHVKTVLVP